MKDQDQATQGDKLDGYVAWHPDPGWSNVSLLTGETNIGSGCECFEKLQNIFDGHEFIGFPGVSEEMMLAVDGEEFDKAAVKAGWRIRPVKLTFLDED